MSMFRRLIIQGMLAAPPCVALAWLAGATLRDRTLVTSLLFYIPAPVFLFYALLSIVPLFRHGRRKSAALVGCVAGAALVKILAVDFSWQPSAESEGLPLRVVHWNLSHGDAGADTLLRTLRKDAADLYVLSELPKPQHEGFAEALVPGGASLARSDILLVSRFPLEAVKGPTLDGAGLCGARVMMPGGGYIEVLAVDFVSDPRRSRRERVARLARWTKRRARNAPLLIVGDFNAPRDSIHFEKLRKRGLKHAYEEGGRGQWPYTWPLPCPFYAIDHAWLYRLYPASYRLVRSSSSDHSRQIMDLRAR